MPKLPGISYAQAVRVFGKVGFSVAREGKHTIMSNDKIQLTIPRHNPTPLRWRTSRVTPD